MTVRSKSSATKVNARSTTSSNSPLQVRSYSGLSKKRMESNASANFGLRLNIKQGDTIPVQFLQGIDDFKEYDIHSFREDGRWTYVPCIGDNCPLCQDEDDNRRKVTYRFCCNVYNLKDKKVQLIEGPKDLASRIYYRYSRAPQKFLKRTFEITKLPTTPVTYDVALAEEPVVPTRNLELKDLQDYINEESRRYFGSTIPQVSSLDADDELDEDADDLEDDDVEEDSADDLREELENLPLAKLRVRAKKNGAKVSEYKNMDDEELIDLIISQEIDEDDEDDDEEEDSTYDDDDELDDEDDEDEEDEDEDDEDEDPIPSRRSGGNSVKKKVPARRR